MGRHLNGLSWAIAAFGVLALTQGYALAGKLLLGIGLLLSIGAHAGRRRAKQPEETGGSEPSR